MYQDIVSYEQMVESMTEKATELAEKSPASRTTTDTSGVAARYNAVKEQAKVMTAQLLLFLLLLTISSLARTSC